MLCKANAEFAKLLQNSESALLNIQCSAILHFALFYTHGF